MAFKAAAKTILTSALAPEIPPLETSKIPSTRLALFNSSILNSSINSSATELPLSGFQLWISTLYASLDYAILGRWLAYALVL
ncbi:hypothetical protein FHS68_003858 [Dyadobacter arcticus]|uniref:Uncharacterized protein n=1 Tax=Dyadobacter arcticus TaxID=1078754 RepID=A0ABX0UNV9_9BACT|nr:hypothetical protein [Dyadobacter arcticus]NIJ54676.1 hypothetical protein [Dyadobacter arcticus]